MRLLNIANVGVKHQSINQSINVCCVILVCTNTST